MAELPDWIQNKKNPFYDFYNVRIEVKKAQKHCGICGRNFQAHKLKKIHKYDIGLIGVGKELHLSKYHLIICKFCNEDFFKKEFIQTHSFPG